MPSLLQTYSWSGITAWVSQAASDLFSSQDPLGDLWANINGKLSDDQKNQIARQTFTAIDQASGGNTALAANAKQQAAGELAATFAQSDTVSTPWFSYALYAGIAIVALYFILGLARLWKD